MSAIESHCTPKALSSSPARGDEHSFPPLYLTRRPQAWRPVDSSALRLAECEGEARHAAETLIRDRFAAAYDARVTHFMPRLFGLRGGAGPLLGACGLREAAGDKLFLERYLDQPIEHCIAGAVGTPVARHEIVEVGQFAGTGAGAFRSLIQRLTARLHQDGHRWVVFTGTSALRNAFRRLGLEPLDLAAADAGRLAVEERSAWGSYYDYGPRLMCGNIEEGFDEVQRQLAGEGAL